MTPSADCHSRLSGHGTLLICKAERGNKVRTKLNHVTKTTVLYLPRLGMRAEAVSTRAHVSGAFCSTGGYHHCIKSHCLVGVVLYWLPQVLFCLLLCNSFRVCVRKSCQLYTTSGTVVHSICSLLKQNGAQAQFSSGLSLCSWYEWRAWFQTHHILVLISVPQPWGNSTLQRCFTSKNVPKITVSQCTYPTLIFFFWGEKFPNSQFVEHLMKSLFSNSFSFVSGTHMLFLMDSETSAASFPVTVIENFREFIFLTN